MAVEDLERAYLELMMEEPGTSLETFTERVLAGAFGPQEPEAVVTFLKAVERMILGSIQTRAGASGQAAAEADERAEEQRERVAQLIARVRGQGA